MVTGLSPQCQLLIWTVAAVGRHQWTRNIRSRQAMASRDLNAAHRYPPLPAVTHPPAPKRQRRTARRITFAAALGLGLSILPYGSLPLLGASAHGYPITGCAPSRQLSSGDASQDYFADGMTDELITDLAQIRALRVVSRTSVMMYKGDPCRSRRSLES